MADVRMTPIAASCSTRYVAAHSSGTRPLDAIIWIVLHSTEGPTAEAAARWFANENSAGSAHLCVDDNVCYRTLANSRVPWAAPGANRQGFHIEQAGYARWTPEKWLQHEMTLRRSAWKAAWHARKFGIPLRWLSPADLKAGKPGVATHAACTVAFGGDHTDPGSGFPEDAWMVFALDYLDELTAV